MKALSSRTFGGFRTGSIFEVGEIGYLLKIFSRICVSAL